MTCNKLWKNEKSEICYNFCLENIDKNFSNANGNAYEIIAEYLNNNIDKIYDEKHSNTFHDNQTVMPILSPRRNSTFSFENETSKLEMNEENKTICEKNHQDTKNLTLNQIIKTENQSDFKFGSFTEKLESNQSLSLEEKISYLEGVIQNQKAKLLILEDQMLGLQKKKTLEIRDYFQNLKRKNK